MRAHRLFILLTTLLLSATTVAQEQERSVVLRRHEGATWGHALMHGGVVRGERTYLVTRDGVSDLVSMNYVDGYLWGPSGLTVGHIYKDYSRLEISPMLRYASARRAWLASANVRYTLAPHTHSWVEVFGGRYTDDIDEAPAMDEAWRGLASGLFGWNEYRLYERTTAGLRTSVAILSDVQLTGRLSYEGRRPMSNHQLRNVFRVRGEDNVPTSTDVAMMRADLALSYTPGRQIYVIDDMTAEARSPYPTVSLLAGAGRGFLSLELSATQSAHWGSKGRDAVAWMLAAGFFPTSLRPADIVDARHFDASRFWWQRDHKLTHLAMLGNYELSTRHAWSEGHAEWSSARMLIGRLTADDAIGESIGIHAAKAACLPLHTECTYSISLADIVRLGITVGLDDTEWDGVAFTLSVATP